MGRVLAISSQVARGHVGLSAIVPALQRLGHDVIALPTILLSNHPGHAHVAGEKVAADLLRRMLDALEANGWLGEIDAVMTGYLPSVAHVEVAIEAIRRVQAHGGGARVLTDPVLGDDPKGVYIDTAAAERIRDALVPLADTVTPNAFELGWLTGAVIRSTPEAIRAAAVLSPRRVLVTSAPSGGATLDNVLVDKATGQTLACAVPRQARVPNGTGDLLAALYLGHELSGRTAPEALALTVGGLEALIKASAGREELQLISAQTAWADAAPWPVRAG
jgi:pyridoxine kinase